MATLSYAEQSTPYARTPAQSRGGYLDHRDMGSTIFLWVAWALAAAFWSATFTTALGIMSAVMQPSNPGPAGGADAGGVGFALMDVVGGMLVLGLALAYGMYRYMTRDKRLDPVTEASTHALYDMVEQAGGDDDVTRSPETRKPLERDAYRAIEPNRL